MTEFPAKPPPPSSMRRLLVVGGTFDPPHRAHVQLVLDAARQAGCDHILFVPANRSPHKDAPPTPAEHRLAMLQLALADCENVSISTFEIERPGSSYTVETLEALRAALNDEVELRLLLGADQAIAFDRWRNPQRILELATPVVLPRPPHTRKSLTEAGVDRQWLEWMIDLPTDPLSSTDLRRRLARGEDVGDAVDPAVLDYIRRHGLYTQR